MSYLYLRKRTPEQAAAELLPAHIGHVMHAALRGERFEVFTVHAIVGDVAQVTTRNGDYDVPSHLMWMYGTPRCMTCERESGQRVSGEDRAI